jgi:DNA invertase Pin-like site-specific DNA recombinase
MATKTGQRKTEASARRAGKLFGYARVSTTDQDLALQREVLERAGANPIFDEKASGTKRDGRTELQRVLSILREGDALVVTRLDRLGRSMRDLANIAHEIEQAEAHLKVIEQSVDTSTAAGRAFFGMLAVFAAFETDVRRERQLEGIGKAPESLQGWQAAPRQAACPGTGRRRGSACSHCSRAGYGSQFSLPAA